MKCCERAKIENLDPVKIASNKRLQYSSSSGRNLNFKRKIRIKEVDLTKMFFEFLTAY